MDVDADADIIVAGLLKKKSRLTTRWGERYFVLRGHTLYYYATSADTKEIRGAFPLQDSTVCHVSPIKSDRNRKRTQFIFKVSWRVEEDPEDKEEGSKDAAGKDVKGNNATGINKKSESSKETEKSSSSGGKVAAATVGGIMAGALSSGLGLLAGMMVVGMGAAAGGSAMALTQSTEGYMEKVLSLACDTYQEAEKWTNAIEAQIQDLDDNQGASASPTVASTAAFSHGPYRQRKHTPHPEIRLDDVEEWLTHSKWKVFAVHEGVRLLQQVLPSEESSSAISSGSNGGGPTSGEGGYHEAFFSKSGGSESKHRSQGGLSSSPPPCMRVNLPINASAADTFTAVFNFTSALRTGVLRSIRIVENIDNFTDIIHLKVEPVYLYPTWTAPRDFCLMRYWRDNADGSFVVCLDSTHHVDCPLSEGYVRGDLHAAYLITPPRTKAAAVAAATTAAATPGAALSSHGSEHLTHNHSSGHSKNYIAAPLEDDEADDTECMLSFIAQLDPKGWIWNLYGYKYKFMQEFMLLTLDIRDALEADRFLQVHFDPIFEPKKVNNNNNNNNSDNAGDDGTKEGEGGASGVAGSMATIPADALLDRKYWCESDASTFKVRGLTYNKDKVKVSSDKPVFKLIAADFFQTTEAVFNICSHPRNRVRLAKERGDGTWVFAINIMVPGPPFYSFVVYMEGDKSVIEADTPFGRIARPFFYGNDDEFRNNRFKLIPMVLEGNMIVKMAVKDTPTLLGNKLKQSYFKGENYFELDVDVGSSSVAKNVVGIALGYSKSIVVSMGFCLQGNEEEELPEILMGAVTVVHVDYLEGTKPL